ncbi:MAG TPA: decaprenyl-phosphate phosphoribosyltransferase [Minicystis sp.]|nr:decaprenyl-phosphate phosphoribosyltransferase [Minicystis sp.]
MAATRKPVKRGHLVAVPPPPSSEAGTPLAPPPVEIAASVESPSSLQQVPLLPESPSGSFLWRVRGIVRTLRPHQWVKNLFVLAPVVFAKELTHASVIVPAVSAFVVFCMLAGAVYTLNDLVDVESDRRHPVKRKRPIASGCVPVPLAKVMAGVLAVGALGGALFLPTRFFFVACAYYALNLAYSFRLKKIAYVDVACLAAMFCFRVLAGGFATHTHVSFYMIACTALLSLFLGFGKRRHELAAMHPGKTRSSLEAYTPAALTAALAVTGVATVANYVAYTLDPEIQHFFGTRWLPITTVHTVFGVVRFLQLVAGRPKAESPTQEMLRDVPFVLNLVLWVLEVIAFLYNVRLSAT